MLCLAADTGLAPILALAEAALRRGVKKPVIMMFSAQAGARPPRRPHRCRPAHAVQGLVKAHYLCRRQSGVCPDLCGNRSETRRPQRANSHRGILCAAAACRGRYGAFAASLSSGRWCDARWGVRPKNLLGHCAEVAAYRRRRKPLEATCEVQPKPAGRAPNGQERVQSETIETTGGHATEPTFFEASNKSKVHAITQVRWPMVRWPSLRSTGC